MNPDPIADLKAYASERGVKITAATAQAGIAYSTYWRWKEGKALPNYATVLRVRRAIDQLADKAA